MRKENTSEEFVIGDIVPLLHSEGATNMKEGLYDLAFVLDGQVYRLSVQNIPTVILEKKCLSQKNDPMISRWRLNGPMTGNLP